MSEESPLVDMAAGEAGKRWAAYSLGIGHGLAAAVLALGIKGTVYALVPPDISGARLAQLSDGGLASPLQAIGELASRALHHRVCVMIVEDELRSPGDPALSRLESRKLFNTFYCGNEVYHWLRLASAGAQQVCDILRHGTSFYPGNIFIAAVPEPVVERLRTGVASKEVLVGLAEAVIAVAVSAFDGESFLWWKCQK